MTRRTVAATAHLLTRDIDPNASIDVRVLDGHVLPLLALATEILKKPLPPYSESDRAHLMQMLEAMSHSHKSIRELLSKGSDDPRSVDALAISRLQLETLYTCCLLFEQPEYVSKFVKSGWRKMYVRFLLQKAETKNLPRWVAVEKDLETNMEGLRHQAGVSDNEKLTIDIEELGLTAPPGFVPERIRPFPLPGKIIGLLQNLDTISMLERLYPEYEYLCSFTHASVEGWLIRTMLFKRSPYQRYMEAATPMIDARAVVFDKQVAHPAILYSVLSVAQICAELTARCKYEYELVAKVTEAWRWLSEDTLLGQAIWHRRTKSLLGAIG